MVPEDRKGVTFGVEDGGELGRLVDDFFELEGFGKFVFRLVDGLYSGNIVAIHV